MLSYLKSVDDSNRDPTNELPCIELFLKSHAPIKLARDMSLLVTFANLKNLDLFKMYAEVCTFKRLMIHGHLIEWMFANVDSAKTIRKLVADNFDDAFNFTAQAHESLDDQVFETW
jgi:hypothetical protein